MPENGKLPKSELAPIPGGELRKDAAVAWNAPGGPADAGLRPTGSRSSYRTYGEQQELYAAYMNGTGNLAAVPGTSNHGWGLAVDLAETWMADWIQAHGGRYGWKKTEAFSEWWHYNFIGGVSFPSFEPLRHGMRGKRVAHFARRLRFIHPAGSKHGYLRRPFWKFKDRMVQGVKAFQRDQGLKADGVIGPRTAARINGVFKRQFRERGRQ